MTCSVCGNAHQNRLFEAREMMFGTGDRFRYLDCGACGCVQLLDVPADLSPFYPADYYSFAPPVAPKSARKRRMKYLRDHYAATGKGWLGRWLMQHVMGPHPALQSLAPLRLSTRAAVLDVGCGQGNLLRDMQGIGFVNLLGADPFLAEELRYESGLTILKKALPDVPGQFDLVMMHHAFEHMAEPQAVMQPLADHLRPGGTALLRIPVADSWAYRHYGPDWAQLDAPRHLFLHTRRSIERLGQAAGLSLVRVAHDSSAFQFWGSEQYRRGIPLMAPESYRNRRENGPFSTDEIAAFEQRARQLNAAGEGDQACFYLRKA